MLRVSREMWRMCFHLQKGNVQGVINVLFQEQMCLLSTPKGYLLKYFLDKQLDRISDFSVYKTNCTANTEVGSALKEVQIAAWESSPAPVTENTLMRKRWH